MKLVDVLHEDYIIPSLKAKDKEGLLCEMVDYLKDKMPDIDREKTLQALFARERLGTTGIGHSVALPHGKLKGVDEITVFFGRSTEGVDFKAIDSQPVHLVFLIIAPENSAAAHLKLLACISRILKSRDLRRELMDAADPASIFKLIAEADKKNTR
ncbi:MAG: PTS sugar transporter subunit IIA [Thermodesulfobacteriota bacterium]